VPVLLHKAAHAKGFDRVQKTQRDCYISEAVPTPKSGCGVSLLTPPAAGREGKSTHAATKRKHSEFAELAQGI